MTRYELHPLCTLFPRMEGAALENLRADIKANGLREPITLLDGMILDGGNRYAACVAAGIEPTFIEFSGDSIASFVLSENLHRRHLTPGQQAAIVASVQDWTKAQAHGGDRKSDQPVTLPLDSVADRMAQSGASDKTQRMADKVAKADPELAKKVAHGDVTLPKAVEQVTGKKRKARSKPAKTAVPTEPAKPVVAPDGTDISDVDIGGDPVEMLAELQKENDALREQIKVLTADDTKAELHKMILQRDIAVQRQSEAMDQAALNQKIARRWSNVVVQCTKILGLADRSELIAAVKRLAAMREAA